MAKIKVKTSRWGTSVVILSLLLFFFTVPHTLEDFATGEPVKAGIPAPIISTVISAMFALQALALFWTGRRMHRSYVIHVFLGLFWPISAGAAQLPTILSGSPYRAGFISVFYVGGMIVIGILLFIVSMLALRAGRSK